jgi:hypothetical protein
VHFSVAGTPWSIRIEGATHTEQEYVHQFATAGWTLDVMEWPDSTVFVQTLTDHLASARGEDPAVEVLVQEEAAGGGWAAVTRGGGAFHGAVLITGQLNVMCSFDVPDSADWKPALAACRSVTNEITREEE